jgi:hypothetical protein
MSASFGENKIVQWHSAIGDVRLYEDAKEIVLF